jgi:hypothetical protein
MAQSKVRLELQEAYRDCYPAMRETYSFVGKVLLNGAAMVHDLVEHTREGPNVSKLWSQGQAQRWYDRSHRLDTLQCTVQRIIMLGGDIGQPHSNNADTRILVAAEAYSTPGNMTVYSIANDALGDGVYASAGIGSGVLLLNPHDLATTQQYNTPAELRADLAYIFTHRVRCAEHIHRLLAGVNEQVGLGVSDMPAGKKAVLEAWQATAPSAVQAGTIETT